MKPEMGKTLQSWKVDLLDGVLDCPKQQYNIQLF